MGGAGLGPRSRPPENARGASRRDHGRGLTVNLFYTGYQTNPGANTEHDDAATRPVDDGLLPLFIGTGNLDFMEFGLFFFANGGIQVFTADNIDVVDGEIEFALGPTDATVSYTVIRYPCAPQRFCSGCSSAGYCYAAKEKILS